MPVANFPRNSLRDALWRSVDIDEFAGVEENDAEMLKAVFGYEWFGIRFFRR